MNDNTGHTAGATPEDDAAASARLAANRDRVRERIARAAVRAGRDPTEVTLVCVTKTVPAATVWALHAIGERDFGENRVADGAAKVRDCGFPESGPDAARWHLIGHLQRNKAAAALAAFRLIHGLESLKLAATLDRLAGERGIVADVWLEANLAGEESKYGAAAAEIPALAAALAAARNLRWRGLMTMAPFTDDPETARPVFRRLREWRDRLSAEYGLALGLSMGMSGDFEVAVEEGATLVRVGTALYS